MFTGIITDLGQVRRLRRADLLDLTITTAFATSSFPVGGAIALDGVSLTVNEVAQNRFGVNVIPHTLSCTNLGQAQPGQQMNLEIDPIARYVARLLPPAR